MRRVRCSLLWWGWKRAVQGHYDVGTSRIWATGSSHAPAPITSLTTGQCTPSMQRAPDASEQRRAAVCCHCVSLLCSVSQELVITHVL
ncbi:hypothetical protein C8Q76DRAFT_737094 [Earliella scabrosa]|nr:hypothetical protein C8Q76DRAFT_737094 [Earliella scabrosa]